MLDAKFFGLLSEGKEGKGDGVRLVIVMLAVDLYKWLYFGVLTNLSFAF